MKYSEEEVQKIVNDWELEGKIYHRGYSLAKDWLEWAQKEKQYINALKEGKTNDT